MNINGANLFKIFFKRRIINSQPSLCKPRSRNRRQFERYDIRKQHLVAFNCEDIAKIIDISAKGFSCIVSQRAFDNFTVSDAYEAYLRYLGETYSVNIKVAWKRGHLVGFELQNFDEKILFFLNRLIKPLAIANSLKPVDASFLQESSSRKVWYHGDEGTDLVIWRDAYHNLEAWQLVFDCFFLEWNANNGLITGTVKKSSTSTSDLAIPSDELLECDSTISLSCKTQGIDLLMALGNQDAQDILPTLTGD